MSSDVAASLVHRTCVARRKATRRTGQAGNSIAKAHEHIDAEQRRRGDRAAAGQRLAGERVTTPALKSSSNDVMLGRLPLQRLAQILREAGSCILWIVVAAVPAGYGWISFESQSHVSAMQARTWAALAGQLAQTNGHWQHDLQLMLDAAALPEGAPAMITVHNRSGLIIAAHGEQPAWPTTAETAVVTANKLSVGEVTVSRSLNPILVGTLLTALLAAIVASLGLAIRHAMRRDALLSLQTAAPEALPTVRNSRQETEDRLRIVFENSIDGIMTFLPDGTVLSCNPAASQLFGRALGDLIGLNLNELITPFGDSQAFPIGLHETVAHRIDGPSFPVEVTVSQSRLKGVEQMIAFVRDITERRAAQDRMALLANYDSLTGLPNRVLFRDRLREGMKRAKRTGHVMGLMFLDLDRFKVVNDSLGHEVGDRLLQHVSQTLLRCVRAVDSVARDTEYNSITVSRLGGDEFTIIIEDIGGADDAAIVARRILDALLEPFITGGEEIVISTSIGISLYPHDNTDLDGLIRHTDMAMYRSKALGRNTYSFYNANMNAEVEARLSLETSLRHAIDRNEFHLLFQPKADLRTGRITGVEALLRWTRPGEGVVPPDQFITILEETGLILPVGAWVIRTACAELAAWDKLGLPPLSMAVNLSARQFRHQYLFQLISETLAQTRIAPHRLELELTESQLLEDNDASRSMLASIAALGVRVAIDDFGTGHSSLSYLKRFNIDTLKIDRSFVREITSDEEDSAIATAVIALGRSLDLKVVAEGVETLHQADYLRALGCDEIQGYLLSRPLSSDKLVAWLGTYRGARVLGVGDQMPDEDGPMSDLLSLDLVEDEAVVD
jgi:diguanylate cyclase